MKFENVNWVNGKAQMSVFNISHADLDGVGCAIVLNNLFEKVESKYVTYYGTLNPVIKEMENNPFALNKYDIIMITDVSLTPDQMKRIFITLNVAGYQGQFIFLDHHESSKQLHNPKANIYVVDGVCGTKITKTFCESLLDTKLDHLNEMAELINDYDLWKHENPNSKKLQHLLTKEMKLDIKQGLPNFAKKYHNGIQFNNLNESEKLIIKNAEDDITEVWDNLEVNLIDNSRIAFCFVNSDYINEMSDRLLNSPEVGVDVVITFDPKKKNGSIRASASKIKNMNLTIVVEEISKTSKVLSGSGHKLASGFYLKNCEFNSPDKFEKVQKAVAELSKALMIVYPELKK